MAAVQPSVPRVLGYMFLPEGKVSHILRGISLESRPGKQKFHFIKKTQNPSTQCHRMQSEAHHLPTQAPSSISYLHDPACSLLLRTLHSWSLPAFPTILVLLARCATVPCGGVCGVKAKPASVTVHV